MTITKYSQKFTNSAGIAHGHIGIENLPFVGPMACASLAFEHSRNPAMLESPTYQASFPPDGAGIARAVKALKSAAHRRDLKPCAS